MLTRSSLTIRLHPADDVVIARQQLVGGTKLRRASPSASCRRATRSRRAIPSVSVRRYTNHRLPPCTGEHPSATSRWAFARLRVAST
jgi:hypothetical protein